MLGDVFFEDAQRVGIGDHQRGDVFIHGARERFDIHHAAIVGLDVLHFVSGHGGGGGIGAVRGIGDQELLARIALRLKQRADQQDAGEFAVRAGGGLQRDGVHAGDFGEHALPAFAMTSQNALRERFGLIRMRPRQAFDARHLLIHARVVLHGAGAERIEAQIDGVVPGGEAREVADDFHFADFREVFDFRCACSPRPALRPHRPREHRAREADSRAFPGELFSNSSGSFWLMCWRTFLIISRTPPLPHPSCSRRDISVAHSSMVFSSSG